MVDPTVAKKSKKKIKEQERTYGFCFAETVRQRCAVVRWLSPPGCLCSARQHSLFKTP
ncbi:hypothetical protein XFF6992_550002 [Xanthomonas citri pv. fuscans]|nr:hypothetical protein XFF6992_550002 [Xanthomonas citri pv. fuscans]SOO35465.1 hypothetical protein XFF6994_5370017 [Xanthomonas citri pv. fuscans]